MVVISHSITAFAALASLVTGVVGSPLRNLEERQSGSFFAVTGVKSGGVQPRLEIRTLARDPVMLNLYLLAMREFQATDFKDKLSYYQLSGIHGMPYYSWDGAQQNGQGSVGYCAHSTNLFGIWHRPYLAAFEQILSDHAHKVADKFPEGDTKRQYQDAAGKLRAPYWDWAMKDSGGKIFHPVLTSRQVDVTHPDGKKESINNPLYQYSFSANAQKELSSPYSNSDHTYRMMTNGDSKLASNDDQLEQVWQDQFSGIQPTVYRLLTQYQTFNKFSSSGSDASSQGSLEAIHGTIHVLFGNSFMQNPASAGFDPIFFLHHANVDRLVALYQKLYPSSFMEPAIQRSQSFSILAGTTTDKNTALAPFHRSSTGGFWTSDQAKDVGTFGYTYPELAGNPDNNTVVTAVNNLYRTSATSIGARMKLGKRDGVYKPRDYLAQIQLPLNALDSPYSVMIFLGDVPSNSADWSKSKNFIGAQSAFVNAGNNLSNDLAMKGSVALTEALKAKYECGDLKALDPETVVKYLLNNVHWRIVQGDCEVKREDPRVKGVEVQIVSSEVVESTSDCTFPQYVGGFVNHFNAACTC